MRAGGDVGDGQRRLDHRGERENGVRDFSCVKVRHRRHGPRAAVLRRAAIARPDHGGEHELVAPFGRHQALRVAQLHVHLVAGQDVRDVHREHVRTILLEQRAGLAARLRFAVFQARLPLLLDRRLDLALAEAEAQAVHRRLRRAREDVARLDRARAFVAIVLRDDDVGGDAGDAHLRVGGLQRQPVHRRIAARDLEVGAFRRWRLGIVGRRDGDEADEEEGVREDGLCAVHRKLPCRWAWRKLPRAVSGDYEVGRRVCEVT